MKIIANAYVVTCDPDNRAGRYHLLVSGNRIIEISERLDTLASLSPQATIIDASRKLVIPGFVNAHFHSESVLLRARTDGLHCSLWKSDEKIQRCIKGLLDPLGGEDIRNVYRMSYYSHLKSGTTCVGEFGLPYGEPGFGTMLSTIDRTEVKNVVALQNWDQIGKARTAFGNRHRGVVSVGRTEDFTVYSFDNLTRAARDLKVPLIAHVGEQRSEVEFVKRSFQRNILEVLRDYVVVAPETVFVHMNHLSTQEVEALGGIDASVVVCARSTAFKRTGYPSLRYLGEQEMRLAIGTDWGNTDMLEEMKFLRQLPLLIANVPNFSPRQLVRMATINGARALGLSHETGSIEVGKKADLTFYSLDDMRLPALSGDMDADQLSILLVDHLSCRDVSDVMVNGEFYLTNGTVMMMDEQEIVGDFRMTHKKFFGEENEQQARMANSEPLSGRGAFKILPFSSAGRTAQPPPEGFESGFEATKVSNVSPGSKGTKRSQQRAQDASIPPADTIQRSPEPPKENWLTFGEDETF